MHRRRLLALLEGTEALRWRGLAHVHRPVEESFDRGLSGRRVRVLGGKTFLFEESTRDRGDQRCVERGEPRELDAELIGHGVSPRAVMRTGVYAPAPGHPGSTWIEPRWFENSQ